MANTFPHTPIQRAIAILTTAYPTSYIACQDCYASIGDCAHTAGYEASAQDAARAAETYQQQLDLWQRRYEPDSSRAIPIYLDDLGRTVDAYERREPDATPMDRETGARQEAAAAYAAVMQDYDEAIHAEQRELAAIRAATERARRAQELCQRRQARDAGIAAAIDAYRAQPILDFPDAAHEAAYQAAEAAGLCTDPSDALEAALAAYTEERLDRATHSHAYASARDAYQEAARGTDAHIPEDDDEDDDDDDA